MPTYTYGSSTSDFVEVIDPTRDGQTMRPPAGYTVKVKSATTGLPLPDELTAPYGYLPFTSTEPSVVVSTDNFATSKTLYGKEALDSAIAAATNIATAVTKANEAAASAGQAASAANSAATSAAAAIAGGGGGLDPALVNAPGGVAGLGTDAKVAAAQLPIGTGTGKVMGGDTALAFAQLPPGAFGGFIRYDAANSRWPARPSARTDISFRWVALKSENAPVPPLGGAGGAVAIIDRLEQVKDA